MNDLAGRVALVTGGGRDVGAAISLSLAAAGAAVAGAEYTLSMPCAFTAVTQPVESAKVQPNRR